MIAFAHRRIDFARFDVAGLDLARPLGGELGGGAGSIDGTGDEGRGIET